MDAKEIVSLLLYDICCRIGLSSSQRKRNIQWVDGLTTLLNMNFNNDSTDTILVCGSQSEGIRLFPRISSFLGMSSDIDHMQMIGGIKVQEHVESTNTNQTEVLQLLATHSPEHFLLEVKSYESACKTFNNSPLRWILKVIKKKHNKYLISSSLLKDYIQRKIVKRASCFPSIPVCRLKNVHHYDFVVNPVLQNTTIHGPAVMTEKGPHSCSSDLVYCLRSYEWPTAAHEWIDRARPHGWPSQDLIDQIKNDGCELVPIGRKDHSDEDVQWKLSFSRAETRLIRSFDIYQAQCYQLLKIVKTYYISSVVADSLSSYHIKTVMLHTIEQTDPEVWRKDNIVQCFMMCLSNLKRYLTNEHLPQYFIVEQNVLEPKVTGNVHQKVLEIVTYLEKIWWNCILNCPQFLHLCWILKTIDIIPYPILTGVFALEENTRMIYDSYSALLLNNLAPLLPVSYNRFLIGIVGLCEKTFLKPTAIHPSVGTARVLQLLRKSELGLLLTVIWAMAKPDLRPRIEPMMNYARQCLEESCHADVSSCRLKFATFLFHMREYDRCIATVQDVLERFKNVCVVVGGLGTTDYERKETFSNMDTSKLEFKLNQVLQLFDNDFPFISNHWSLPATFIRWELAVAPKGVQFLNRKMPRRKDLMIEARFIDSIVYAHYLLLESYLKIHEYDFAEHALVNMNESILNGNDDAFDRNCLWFSDEDNLLLEYSESLMKVAKSVKDK